MIYLFKSFIRIIDHIRLRYKLSIVYGFIIIVPILIIGEYSYTKTETFIVNEIISSLEKEISQVADHIEHKLFLASQQSNQLFLDKGIRNILSTDYKDEIQSLSQAYLDIIIPTFDKFRNMKLYDARIYTYNYTLFFDKKNIFPLNQIKDNPFYRALLENKVLSTWLPPMKIEEQNVLTISKMMYNYTNSSQLLGILDVYVPILSFFDILESFHLPPGGWILYLDSNNNEICHIGDINYEDLNKIIPELNFKFSYGTIKREKSILVFRKVPINNSFIVVYYPRNIILDRIRPIRAMTRTIALVSIVVVLLISFGLSNLITRRLEHFIKKIQKIKDTGIMDIDDRIPGNDEVADIDKVFTGMLLQINILTQQKFQNEINKKIMEMKLLQEQINPHFLYNSLSSIKWAVHNTGRTNLPEIIDNVIDSMVKFYRLSLNKGQEIISVQNELEIVKCYISVQKFTYDSTFDVLWDVDPETLKYCCIKLILQPFVENAILHGLNPKKTEGLLKISSLYENSSIVFIIEDNGVGFDAENLKEKTELERSLYGGFGIHNSIKRIHLVYGERSRVAIKSKSKKGTKVIIEVPAFTYEEISSYLNSSSAEKSNCALR